MVDPGKPLKRRNRGRLSRSGEFDRVYRDGEGRSNRYLVLYAFPRDGDDGADLRLGLSVGRKLGGAVVRNRVKRALREAFWAVSPSLPAHHDFVIVARPDAADLIEREGAAGAEASLRELTSTDAPEAPDTQDPPGQERLT